MRIQSSEENEFLKDLHEIENLCSVYDLSDAASNKRLHNYLKKQNMFSSWLGDVFMAGLANRSKSEGYRRTFEQCFKMIAFSFMFLAVVLLAGLAYLKVQEEKENAVLEYIRQEHQLAMQNSAGTHVTEEVEPQDTPQDEEYSDVVANELEAEGGEGLTITPDILDDYVVLANMYPNVVGWIRVGGTSIDYPVMQDKEDENFYLNHNFEGKTDSKGALFVDADASTLPIDQNLIIFGHNMRDGSMFGDLSKFLEKDFYKKHHTIEFDTLYEKGTYEVVAVVKTAVKQEDEEGFRYYWFRNYNSMEEFRELEDFVKKNQIYDTGNQLEYGNCFLMLSTCEYSVDNGRLVVIARKV